jgi:hypothetical protein
VRLSAGRYHSFVGRVWSGDGADPALRGQITHIASHQSAGFADLERILAFIRGHVTSSEAACDPTLTRSGARSEPRSEGEGSATGGGADGTADGAGEAGAGEGERA